MSDRSDIFADSPPLPRRLYDQLMAAPVLEILGVVDAMGSAAVQASGDPCPTFMFRCERWRIGGGEVRTQRLTVLMREPERTLRRLRVWFDPFTVRRIRAHFVSEFEQDGPQAYLVEFIGPDAGDRELLNYADEMLRPVTHIDPDFGTLRLDRDYSWYTGAVRWCGSPVQLIARSENDGDLAASLRTARLLWQNQSEWNVRLLNCAATALLPMKNKHQRQAGQPEITADEFRSGIKWRTIVTQPDHAFKFWSDADAPFSGEQVRVTGDLSNGATYATVK